jgi:hypothetical protein
MVEEVVEAQDDMELVDTVGSPCELVDIVRDLGAEIVIAGFQTPELPPELHRLLTVLPLVKVLGIEAAAGTSHIYEMRPHHSRLGDLTAEEVLDAIRSATEPVG